MAASRIIAALMLSASVAFGGVINVSSNAQLTAANAAAVAGDTVKLAAGTYTVQIAPANSGTSGHPIVYMPAVAGTVCSLYVSGSSPVYIVKKNYVIVQGLRIQMAWSTNNYVINIDGSWHGALLDNYIYGGSTHNTSGWGDWPSVRIDSVRYYRVIGNTLDRQDVDITTDDDRGDGIAIYDTLSRYNIVEGNTCYNVSHAAIAVPYGSWTNPSIYNIVRFNTTYNCHIGWGAADQHQRNLFEGNRSYYPGPPLTYRGGVSTEGHGKNGIYRYNESYDDITSHAGSYVLEPGANSPFLTQGSFAEFMNCRLYGNVWLGSNSLTLNRHGVFIQDGSYGSDGFGGNVWKNNIIASPNPQYAGAPTPYGKSCPMYYEHTGGTAAFTDTLDGNLFWDKTPADTILAWDYEGWVDYRTLASVQSTLPDNWKSANLNASPLWVDSTSKGGNRSFAISATSPCVNAGVALTTVASNVSSSAVVAVGDAGYFHYDWGMNPWDRGDSVAFTVGSVVVARGEIDSVDYWNHRLVLKSAITVSAGAGVHVLATYRTSTASYINRMSGIAPDIGPYERTEAAPVVTLPGSTTLVSPADGSTQLQPVTFRWRAVSGATRYWFSLSGDDWNTLTVNNSALTDTFIVVTGLTPGAWYKWNVATGNATDWNTAAWSSWWDVEIGENVTPTDTINLDWNKVVTDGALESATLISMSNIQRLNHTLVLRNPDGYTVQWPANVKWPGMTDVPQPGASDTTIYVFYRGSDNTVYGFDMTAQAAGSGVSATWVVNEIADRTAGFMAGETAPLLTGNNTSPLGRVGTFSGASATTLWYGHVDKTSDGTLVYGYAYGGTQLRFRTSTDNGKTWSDFTSAIDAPDDHIFNGSTFGITPSGAWVFLSSDDTTALAGSYVKALRIRSFRSTDQGNTWSVTDSIATTMAIDLTSGITSLSDGTLLAAYGEGAFSYYMLDTLYGSPANHDTTYIRVIRSTDDGVTWSAPTVAYAHHDSVYQLNEPFLTEPAIAADASDHVVMICRNPDYGTSQLVSADGGVTWTFSGVIGQTNCGPGAFSSNSTSDLLTLNDSTFMAVVGYRLNQDGPGTDAGKIGYLHILTGTWNEIQNATFGWNTFVPPTHVEYGDAGAHRAVIANDTTLVLIQLQGGRAYRMTPPEIVKARANWVLSGKESMQFRPIQTYNFADRLIIYNTDWATLYSFNIMTPPQYDSVATSAIGAIPVIGFSAFFDDAGGTDTAWVKLSDANNITMPSNADSLYYQYVDGTTYSSEFRWQTWFPTKLRNASGTSVLGQFEKQIAPVYIKAKSSHNSILNSIEIHMGYIYK